VAVEDKVNKRMAIGKALVLGAGGFIGHHLVTSLKKEGFWVRGADLKLPTYEQSKADVFEVGDLRSSDFVARLFDTTYQEVYQLAADMGGAGYIFSGAHDADVLHNSALINLNTLEACKRLPPERIFYSSSACVYPQGNQTDPLDSNCAEHSAYPADPDSEYGWEKLFSERLYLAFQRNYGINCKIARFHNIFGPLGAWGNGKEKSPAAICRKVAIADSNTPVEIWGDGEQTRSYLYIDECLEGVTKLMRSGLTGPYNIGSEERVSINKLVDLVAEIAGKSVVRVHVPGPLGVRGRNSDNTRILAELGWAPRSPLVDGLAVTYQWIRDQVLSGRIDEK